MRLPDRYTVAYYLTNQAVGLSVYYATRSVWLALGAAILATPLSWLTTCWLRNRGEVDA